MLENALVSGSVSLRTLGEADAKIEYLEWLQDAQVTKYLESRFSVPENLEDVVGYIRSAAVAGNILLAGIFIAEDRHIGNIKLGPIDLNHKRADLGFFIGAKSEWGKGYASTAISLMADYALQELHLEKITAGCYASNIGSMKALMKAGFQIEGTLTAHWVLDGAREDGLVLAKYKSAI